MQIIIKPSRPKIRVYLLTQYQISLTQLNVLTIKILVTTARIIQIWNIKTTKFRKQEKPIAILSTTLAFIS